MPNQRQWYAKMEAQLEHVRNAYTFFFARLAPIRMLGRRLSTKSSASELRRKLIKSALLVGMAFLRCLLVIFPVPGKSDGAKKSRTIPKKCLTLSVYPNGLKNSEVRTNSSTPPPHPPNQTVPLLVVCRERKGGGGEGRRRRDLWGS